MKKFVLFALISCLSLNNVVYSQVIQNCRETKKKFENSAQFTTLTPVTVSEMSELLKKDEKMKIVIEYSPCFPGNLAYIENVILPYWNKQDKSKVSLYLIATNCGYLKAIEPFFAKNNLDIKRYYYKDNSEKFCVHSKKVNLNRDKDIQKSHFVNADSFADFSSNDLKWFIANEHNYVKLVNYKGCDLKGKEHKQIMPILVESLPANINDLNFEVIDNIQLPNKSIASETIKIIWSEY